MNSINGLANFTTRDSFSSEGVSIQQKTGINHINEAKVLTEVISAKESLLGDNDEMLEISIKITTTYYFLL